MYYNFTKNSIINIYNELKRLGDLIVPFKYTSILVNHNTVAGKHKDANNIGQSLLISIGQYTGCNIVIETKVFDVYFSQFACLLLCRFFEII